MLNLQRLDPGGAAFDVDEQVDCVSNTATPSSCYPPLTITEEDGKWIETAFDSVIAASHKVPGAIWSLGKTLVDNAVRKSA